MNWYKAVVSDDTMQSNANIIPFNGSTTFAQSNDVVSKTAYNGTVSGNVTIGSDGDGSKIDFVGVGSGKISCPVIPNISTGNSFSFWIRIKTWSNISATQVIFHNTISWTNITALGVSGWQIRVWLYNWSYFTKKSISCAVNTLYDIFCYYDWSVVYLYVNWVEAEWTNNPLWWTLSWLHIWSRQSNNDTFFTWSIYYIRFYSTALTDTQRTTELALWQKQTARKDCVLEILPDYYAGTALLPTTIYDVKAFTPATPVVISTSFQLDADWVNTALSQPLVQTPYRYAHIRTILNALTMRKDWPWFGSDSYNLWNWDRWWHNVVLTSQILNWSIVTTVFVDWVKRDTDTSATLTRTKYTDYLQIGRVINWWTWLLNWKISNTKIFIWTITDAEGVAMSDWNPIVPANATLLTYPKRPTPYDTTLTDITGNGYDFTITP